MYFYWHNSFQIFTWFLYLLSPFAYSVDLKNKWRDIHHSKHIYTYWHVCKQEQNKIYCLLFYISVCIDTNYIKRYKSRTGQVIIFLNVKSFNITWNLIKVYFSKYLEVKFISKQKIIKVGRIKIIYFSIYFQIVIFKTLVNTKTDISRTKEY